MNVTGITRHYSAGPGWMYCYTYANPLDVGPRAPLQLEFWVPKGRKGGAWLPATPGTTHRTWRRVRPGHSHADKLAHSISRVRDGYARIRKEQCELYTAWAVAAALQSVAVFAGDNYSKDAAKIARLVRREVDVSDILGPAPNPEPLEE